MIITEALTIKDLAQSLKVSEKTCYGLVRKNKIPYVKIGSIYRIPRSAVLDLLSSGDKIDLHTGC